MNEATVYITSALFAISIFPVHFFNYIFVNSQTKYANLNVSIFRLLRIYNINTVENGHGEMQINGKNKKMSLSAVKKNLYKIYNKLCIYKIIQLSDIGMKKDENAYIALTQSAISTLGYKFIQINDSYSKLRNYTVLNYEHEYIRYYAKAVTILNFIVVAKIFLIIIWEKINELKTKKI